MKVFSRRTTFWVLGASLPVACYALGLKAQRLRAREAATSVLDVVGLCASDVAVLAMWCAIALGVRAAVTGRRLSMALGIGLQLALAGYVFVLLGAQGYFMSTGAALDLATLAMALKHLDDTRQVIASASTPGRWLGFGSVLTVLAFGPWLLLRWAGPEPVMRASTRALAALHSFSVAGVALAFALTATHQAASDLARDPLAQLLATAFDTRDSEHDPVILDRAAQFPRGPRKLEASPRAGKKNLLVVLLESTSAGATSLHGPHDTTPFLKELATRATVVDRAYAVLPHTSKALVASLCGVPPRPGVEMVEALNGGIPGKCLAKLLGEQGYRTALFQSATRSFENRIGLAANMGFSELVGGDQLDHEGLIMANYFGYEDRILLEPVKRWLSAHQGPEPFFLAILTNTPHHGYAAPDHYGRKSFTRNDQHNRYLNAVRYQDFFLRDLFAELEREGHLEDTVVAVLGDHGEAFGEHRLSVHDDIMYDECTRIPLLLIDPSGARRGHLAGPVTQLDLAPTLLEMLGYDVPDGAYAGRSVFAEPTPRTLYLACMTDRKCMARLEGSRKLVHSFGRRPDELFDLAVDPHEKHDLAKKRPTEVARARADALDWYRTVRALYGAAASRASSEVILDRPPKVQHPNHVRFGDSVIYLGWSTAKETITPGETFQIKFYFRVLEPLPEGMSLFMHAEDATKNWPWNHRVIEGMYPERHWRAGQYLVDRLSTRVPYGFLNDVIVVRGGFGGSAGRLLTEPPFKRQAAVLAVIPVEGRSDPSEAR